MNRINNPIKWNLKKKTLWNSFNLPPTCEKKRTGLHLPGEIIAQSWCRLLKRPLVALQMGNILLKMRGKVHPGVGSSEDTQILGPLGLWKVKTHTLKLGSIIKATGGKYFLRWDKWVKRLLISYLCTKYFKNWSFININMFNIHIHLLRKDIKILPLT